MTFENLGTRTVPLFLAALLAACGAGNGDETDDTDDTDVDETGSETADTGSDALTPTNYTFFAQLGIDADGKLADFSLQGSNFSPGMFLTFDDDDDGDGNSCSFGYIFTPSATDTDETDETDAPAVISGADAELNAWLDQQGLIDGYRIAAGTYEATELQDEDGNPCVLDPAWANLATNPDEIFLLDVNQDPGAMFVGVGDTLTEDLEGVLDDAIDAGNLTEADKATLSSSYVRLTTTYTLQGGTPTDNLEMVTEAAAVNGSMEIQTSGQSFVNLDSDEFDAGDGQLASGVYLLSGRVIFGLQ